MNSTRQGRETQTRELHMQRMEIWINMVYQGMNGRHSFVKESGENGPSSRSWVFYWEDGDKFVRLDL